LAGGAAEHAPLLVGPVSAGHGQISGPSPAMLGAVGILAAEARQVVHGAALPVRSSRPGGVYAIRLRYINGAGGGKTVRPRGKNRRRRKSGPCARGAFKGGLAGPAERPGLPGARALRDDLGILQAWHLIMPAGAGRGSLRPAPGPSTRPAP